MIATASIDVVQATEASRWLRLLDGLPHAFGHRPEYVQAAADVAGASAVLWSWTRGEARAACPLLLRTGPGGLELATPPGFAGLTVAGGADVVAAHLASDWTACWRGAGAVCAYLQASPWLRFHARDVAAWGTQGASAGPGADCLLWDLTGSPDGLLSAMSPKHRQLLRRWLRGSPRIVDDQATLVAGFPAMYADFIARREVSAAYRYDRAALVRVLGAPGSFLLGVRGVDGALEAATLFLSADGRGDSFLNAATPAGRGHSRGLYWLGALRLREMGVRELNLGGGLPGEDGLADFKRRLGATPVATTVLRQVIDAAGFARACATTGADPTSPWFPPWRAPLGRAGLAGIQAGAQTSTCLRADAEAGERSKSP